MGKQIRLLKEATEVKIGDNGNGHAVHIQSVKYLAEFLGRMGKNKVHTEVALPENTKISDDAVFFLRSPWITTGVLNISMPGSRPAMAPTFFVRSSWIRTGVVKTNIPGNKPAAFPGFLAHKRGFYSGNAVFLRSPWISSYGVFPIGKRITQ
jgi:hypothetical protein